MAGRAPPFWWRRPGFNSFALWPLAAAYGAIAGRRLDSAQRARVALPVLCVGNLTVGGSGKTPVAIALAREAIAMGLKPGFLSRGHGSRPGPPRLVRQGDAAADVGDEPLLLAAVAPVAVSRDRVAGARALIGEGCDFAIMDDGFQSAQLHMDQALIVVDAAFGIGNGRVIPAGPLRAPVPRQIAHADAVVRMGRGEGADAVVRMAARAGKPVFDAIAAPRDPSRLAGRRFLAFAGIGHPAKFFASLKETGAEIAVEKVFGDHHPYTEWQLRDLMAQARSDHLELATTAKDAVRLAALNLPPGFRQMLAILHIDAVFDPPQVPARIVGETLAAYRRRSGKG
ncbi:MAG: tetraacyldisaccharide 4'-kinase [Rhizobiaceae bacterium]|nr:tetraacyldisaccharide 4'-kinase [Rhizobiaceae bacterium]